MITVASLNFFDQQDINTISQGSDWCKKYLLDPTIGKDNYKFVNFAKENPDILFTSCFNKVNINKTLAKCNCHPKAIIYYTGEHPANRIPNHKYDYSISFYETNKTNLFYPLFMFHLNDLEKYRNKNLEEVLSKKNKFCSFVVGNGWLRQDLCIQRMMLFDYINENYKHIDSLGPLKNNVGYLLSTNMEEATKEMEHYKFNICFENTSSQGNLHYITEKIINAYTYGTIPIYAGDKNICKFFNEKSFINCYGKSNKEILEIIKEIDNNDNLYKDMLFAPIFNEKYNLNKNSLKIFLEKICKEKN